VPAASENLFYVLLKLQDKIDQMSLAKKPREVRLDESMAEEFQAAGDGESCGSNWL
jgi:NADH-quinone oxidoreductase subunit B